MIAFLRPHAEIRPCATRPSRCWCAVATLLLTIFLYIIIPKGFFPVQDTGVIQGISQAPPTISSQAMAQKQQELAKVDSGGSRGRKPFVIHRRGRHEHDH